MGLRSASSATTELVDDKKRPEKNSGPNGIWTHDLCDTGAARYYWKIFREWARRTSALFESQVEVKIIISFIQREMLVIYGLPFNDVMLS